MFVAWWHVRAVHFAGGEPEAVRQIAFGASLRSGSQARATLVAGEPVECAVDHSPVELGGLLQDQLGQLLLVRRTELGVEFAPGPVDALLDFPYRVLVPRMLDPSHARESSCAQLGGRPIDRSRTDVRTWGV